MSGASLPDSNGQQPWVGVVMSRVGAMKYGSVQITVHNGRVVQIDHTERVRLDQNGSAGSEAAERSSRFPG